jgi:mRNA-degrading endonuclease toxin of MazEF toxin-antitoxin module
MEDANGFSKVRPVVVVTPTAEIAPGKTVRVVAITTRLSEPLPADHVLLPWDRQGKARSGLRSRCAAVASWQAEIAVENVQQPVGILPPMVIAELLAKVEAALDPPARVASGEPAAQPTERHRPRPPLVEGSEAEIAGDST